MFVFNPLYFIYDSTEEQQNLIPEAHQDVTSTTPATSEFVSTREEMDCLLSDDTADHSRFLNGCEWSEEEMQTLAKLDEDLEKFEEDETNIINSSSNHDLLLPSISTMAEDISFVPLSRFDSSLTSSCPPPFSLSELEGGCRLHDSLDTLNDTEESVSQEKQTSEENEIEKKELGSSPTRERNSIRFEPSSHSHSRQSGIPRLLSATSSVEDKVPLPSQSSGNEDNDGHFSMMESDDVDYQVNKLY